MESTNVYEFMQEYGIEDYDELIGAPAPTWTGSRSRASSGSGTNSSSTSTSTFMRTTTQFETTPTARSSPSGIPAAVSTSLTTSWTDTPPPTSDAQQVALIWEGEPGDERKITYHELNRQASKVANYLESVGVGTGDTVGLYMPMVPEVASILYGCLKVGAIAVPIFSGFGVDATATRIADAECSVLFTGDGFYRRGSGVHLKESADEAIKRPARNSGRHRSNTLSSMTASVSRTTPTRPSAGPAATSGGTKR